MNEKPSQSIYEVILELQNRISKIELVDSNKREIILWLIQYWNQLNKIFGSGSTISKECRFLIDKWRKDRTISLELLQSFIYKTEILVNSLSKLNQVEIKRYNSFAGKNVFIIHGHDELNTRRLLHLLQDDFKLNPVAIFQKPGQGKIIFEKFEENADDCDFSFALFTKDDEVIGSEGKYFQARPNVIFELGWFVKKLGRNRVVLLLQDGVKVHSDYDGISRIQFASNIEEKYKEIKDELTASKLL